MEDILLDQLQGLARPLKLFSGRRRERPAISETTAHLTVFIAFSPRAPNENEEFLAGRVDNIWRVLAFTSDPEKYFFVEWKYALHHVP